jgi:hypothetical protein
MRSNKELLPHEFEASFQIKIALNILSNSENPLAAKENLYAALSALHR